MGKIYVTQVGQPLLGWPHQEKLKIKLDPTADPPVYTVAPSVTEKKIQDELKLVAQIKNKFPTLFTGKLGEYRDFSTLHKGAFQGCSSST